MSLIPCQTDPHTALTFGVWGVIIRLRLRGRGLQGRNGFHRPCEKDLNVPLHVHENTIQETFPQTLSSPKSSTPQQVYNPSPYTRKNLPSNLLPPPSALKSTPN